MPENTAIAESIEFRVKDFASPTAGKIAQSFNLVHRSVGAAQQRIGEFGRSAAMGALGAVGMGFGLHALWEKAKDANMELLRLQKSVSSTILGMTRWDESLPMVERVNRSMTKGREVTEELEKQQRRLHVPIEELGHVYEATAMLGSTKLRMSQQQQLGMTEKIAAATKLFGTSGEAAAFRIARAVAMGGQVMRPYGDKFAMWLQQAIGPVDRRHHLKPDQVMQRISDRMKELTPAAAAMSKGMMGSMEAISTWVTHTVRDLSSPIFQHIGGMIEGWQARLDALRDSKGISQMQIYGEKLLGVFKGLQTASGFIVDHWKVLAGILVAHKLTGMAGGLVGRLGALAPAQAVGAAAGAAGAATGIMNVTAATVNVGQGVGGGLAAAASKGINESMNARLRPTMAETAGKLVNFAGKTMMVTEALGALYMGAQSLAAYLDAQHDKELGKGREAATSVTAVYDFARSVKALQPGGAGAQSAAQSLKTAYEAMGLKMGERASGEKIGQHLQALGPEVGSQLLAHLHYLMPQMVHWSSLSAPGMAKEAGREIADAMNQFMAAMMRGRPEFFKKPGEEGGIKTSGPPVNNFYGNIQVTQDFKDQDPTRVFIAFKEGLAKEARNLTQSALAQPRGT